jgi:hypothetical protein
MHNPGVKLLETYPIRLTAVINAKNVLTSMDSGR